MTIFPQSTQQTTTIAETTIEDKFFEKAQQFALYPTVDKKYFTFEELQEKIKDHQTDKDDKLVVLYASNLDAQHSYIEAAKEKGYEVLLLDSPIVSHLLQKMERVILQYAKKRNICCFF